MGGRVGAVELGSVRGSFHSLRENAANPEWEVEEVRYSRIFRDILPTVRSTRGGLPGISVSNPGRRASWPPEVILRALNIESTERGD